MKACLHNDIQAKTSDIYGSASATRKYSAGKFCITQAKVSFVKKPGIDTHIPLAEGLNSQALYVAALHEQSL